MYKQEEKEILKLDALIKNEINNNPFSEFQILDTHQSQVKPSIGTQMNSYMYKNDLFVILTSFEKLQDDFKGPTIIEIFK